MENQKQSKETIFLPDSFLEEILANASLTSEKINSLTNNLLKKEEKIRNCLEKKDIIYQYDLDYSELQTYTTTGIDGGRAIENLLFYDVGMVGVVAIAGIDSKSQSPLDYRSWFDILPHFGANTMRHITQAIMHLYEFQLAKGSDADFNFIDGRFITPLIGLSAIASIEEAEILRKLEPIFSEVDLAELLESVFFNNNIIAIQKYDSSRNFSNAFLRDFSISIDDRALFSLILKEGEYTKPMPLETFPDTTRYLSSAHITLKGNIFERSTDFDKLEMILSSLPAKIYAVYYRPRLWAPALRLEIPEKIVKNSKLLSELFDCLRCEMLTPEMKEPYPLYLADKMAKSVSIGLETLKEASRTIISKNSEKEANMFFDSYRSE